MHKFKVNGLSVPKIQWKQMDGQTDGRSEVSALPPMLMRSVIRPNSYNTAHIFAHPSRSFYRANFHMTIVMYTYVYTSHASSNPLSKIDKQNTFRQLIHLYSCALRKCYSMKCKEYLSLASHFKRDAVVQHLSCLLYTSPSPRDGLLSRMPSSA